MFKLVITTTLLLEKCPLDFGNLIITQGTEIVTLFLDFTKCQTVFMNCKCQLSELLVFSVVLWQLTSSQVAFKHLMMSTQYQILNMMNIKK